MNTGLTVRNGVNISNCNFYGLKLMNLLNHQANIVQFPVVGQITEYLTSIAQLSCLCSTTGEAFSKVTTYIIGALAGSGHVEVPVSLGSL